MVSRKANCAHTHRIDVEGAVFCLDCSHTLRSDSREPRWVDDEDNIELVRRMNRAPGFLLGGIREDDVEPGTHATITMKSKTIPATVLYVLRPTDRVPLLYRGAILALQARDEDNSSTRWFVREEGRFGTTATEALRQGQPRSVFRDDVLNEITPTAIVKFSTANIEGFVRDVTRSPVFVDEETRLLVGERQRPA